MFLQERQFSCLDVCCWILASKTHTRGFSLQLLCCEVLKPHHKVVMCWLCTSQSYRHFSNKQKTSFTLSGRWCSLLPVFFFFFLFSFPFFHSLWLWQYFGRHWCSCYLKHALCPPHSLPLHSQLLHHSLHSVQLLPEPGCRADTTEKSPGQKKKSCSQGTCVISPTVLLSPGEGCWGRDGHLWEGDSSRG